MTERNIGDTEEYISPKEATTIAFVSTRTLTRLADSGAIRAVKLPSGHRRYSKTDIESLLVKVA